MNASGEIKNASKLKENEVKFKTKSAVLSENKNCRNSNFSEKSVCQTFNEDFR